MIFDLLSKNRHNNKGTCQYMTQMPVILVDRSQTPAGGTLAPVLGQGRGAALAPGRPSDATVTFGSVATTPANPFQSTGGRGRYFRCFNRLTSPASRGCGGGDEEWLGLGPSSPDLCFSCAVIRGCAFVDTISAVQCQVAGVVWSCQCPGQHDES